jgi:excisionase family DNA binding protein
MPKSTYTVKEVANLLGFSTNTVYKYLDDGAIKAVRLGNEGRFRIPWSEVARLLHERGKSIQTAGPKTILGVNLPTIEIKDSPSIFDWFVAFLSMAIGFTQIVNPSYVFAEESLAKFVPYINVISVFLFVGGAFFLGFDIFRIKRDLKHRTLSLIVGSLYLALACIFLSQGIIFSAGYFSVAIILFVSAFKQMNYYTRYILFVNILFFLSGIGAIFRPQTFTNCVYCDGVLSRSLFVAIWLLGYGAFSFLSIKSLKRDRRFVIVVAFIVGVVSLAFSIVSFTSGYWGRAVFGIVLGTFSFVFPFAGRFDSLKAETRKESVISFLWLLGVFFIGSLVLQTVNHSFQKIILDGMEKRAEVAASITKGFIDSKASILSGFMDNSKLSDLLSEEGPSVALDSELKQIYLSSDNSFIRVVVTDRSGKIIDTYPFYLPSQGLNISDREYFREPAAGKAVFLTDLIIPKSPGLYPVVLISLPIIDANGNFLGVILGSIDTSELQKRLETMNSDGTSSFSVVDTKGNYILNPDPQGTIEAAPAGSPAMKSISGGAGSKVAYGHDGILRFTAYQGVGTYGWGVVTSQPLSTALKMYSLMGFASFLFFIMATIGSLSLVMFLRKRK